MKYGRLGYLVIITTILSACQGRSPNRSGEVVNASNRLARSISSAYENGITNNSGQRAVANYNQSTVNMSQWFPNYGSNSSTLFLNSQRVYACTNAINYYKNQFSYLPVQVSLPLAYQLLAFAQQCNAGIVLRGLAFVTFGNYYNPQALNNIIYSTNPTATIYGQNSTTNSNLLTNIWTGGSLFGSLFR